ncbi:Rtf2 RING-finger [Geosmithia morbida]|uniref:Rtf2 RING-finger n=1 Tax=Geosmithia morbida TaxID=1094350 RepID=A0A9P4YUV7_9HYPO|nr:Rtf2 RING-finger [Geosmithia morbida]KAF4122214.1 Rtf2 RING-finger [Geosmithia morbida]
MGNDGGSIPTRRELVKDAARAPTISELKATVLESLGHAWEHCALSGDPIDLESVVSDWRGRLYSYEYVLNGLVPSDDPETTAATPQSVGIRSLRDVAKLKFSKNSDKWVCPISMKEMGPSTKAVYLIPCGHVFAEVAIKEISDTACPECAEPFTSDNVIDILPTKREEVDRLVKRRDTLRAAGLTHTLKKDKSEKKKKRKANDDKADGEGDGLRQKQTGPNSTSKKNDSRNQGNINNPLAASLTAKVLAEQEEKNKRRKLASEPAHRHGESAKT